MKKVSNQLILIAVENQLRAWCIGHNRFHDLPIHNEQCVKIRDEKNLLSACRDLADYLKGDDIQIGQVHIIADASSQMYSYHSVVEESWPQSLWQLLSWEWLAGRFGLKSADDNVLKKVVFPWLVTNDSEAERQKMQQALADEHQTESQKLVAERAKLALENEKLRSQNVALQQVDTENLVRFLPALFPRIFTAIGAVDLALLCGRVEPLDIPNPFPEPSEETLRVLQRDFRSLPEYHQREIVALVARLPQRQNLQVRSEMRALVADLEG